MKQALFAALAAILIISPAHSEDAEEQFTHATEGSETLELHDHQWFVGDCSLWPFNDIYSLGYRRGIIGGTTNAVFSKEGYLYLGEHGADSIEVLNERNGEMVQVSPWKFTLSSEYYGAMQSLGYQLGDHVTFSYRQYTVKSLSTNALAETDYMYDGVERVSEESFEGYFRKYPEREAGEPFNIIGDKKQSFGYVVKASQKGACLQTYELIFQIGQADSRQFMVMSIQNKDLYDYAVAALRAARPVEIFYKKPDAWGRMLSRSKSSYIIYKIKALDYRN